MNDLQARSILGIDNDTPFAGAKSRYRTLCKRYHPDIPETGDAARFSLICTAYLFLLAQEHGVERVHQAPLEVADAINIRSELIRFFDDLVAEFRGVRRNLERNTLDYIQHAVDNCTSSSELDRALKGRIADSMVDMCAGLKRQIRDTSDRIRNSPHDYLCRFFEALYEDRRKYWQITLIRNPVVVLEAIQLAVSLVVAASPSVRQLVPDYLRGVLTPWIPAALLLAGIAILRIQYRRLDPRRQVVPPKLSLRGIADIVSGARNRVSISRESGAATGGIALAVLGTFALPGIGTLVGAALGALIGWLSGRDLDSTKATITSTIRSELSYGLDQVETAIVQWAEQSRLDCEGAILTAFVENCHRLEAMVTRRQLAGYSATLLLPGSDAHNTR